MNAADLVAKIAEDAGLTKTKHINAQGLLVASVLVLCTICSLF